MYQPLLYCPLLGYVPQHGCTRPCCTVHCWGMYPIMDVPGPVVLSTAGVCTSSWMYQALLYCTLQVYVPHHPCTWPCCTLHCKGVYPIIHVPGPVVLYPTGVCTPSWMYTARVCTPFIHVPGPIVFYPAGLLGPVVLYCTLLGFVPHHQLNSAGGENIIPIILELCILL